MRWGIHVCDELTWLPVQQKGFISDNGCWIIVWRVVAFHTRFLITVTDIVEEQRFQVFVRVLTDDALR